MDSNISKTFDPTKFEDRIYKKWEKSRAFTPQIDKKKEPFVISMPPPNATGQLHLGHAVMLAIEDIMIRFHRMKGDSALWIPGTDHAAIATQNKVEKIIAEEGTDRHTLGRAKFLARVKKYVAESQGTIRNQIRKMGASCDWTRERYTMDDGLSHAVRTIFERMYNDKLIYRGDRIVNWCTRCQSTLADDEVEYKEEKTAFYYFKFGPFSIGTVRPETKLADKVVIVHPDDKRYKKWHHKKMMIPWIDRNVEMYVIPDKAADMKMGSGAMTITPAHSFVDFELARRYKIPIFNIIGEDGCLTDNAGRFHGMKVKDARKKFVKLLEKKGLVEKIDEEYVHNISVCYRCNTPVEPLISKQWFVDVNKKIIPQGAKKISLKEASLDVVRSGAIEIIPDHFNKTYFHWMENLHDWCISRQIWWGHRIPVWYCKNKECEHNMEPIVRVDKLKKCPKCKHEKFKQDPDTLDTWFSSALWTFSTLGWPKKTKELEYFHPTAVLETGHDILFFWVARMIIMSLYATGDVPFRTVYLHGLVTDKEGRKMSKSLGNGIDPLDMIAKYGADAVRLSLLIGSSPGNSMKLYEEKIAGFRNFINKIWNASRYAMMNIPENDKEEKFSSKQIKSRADKWIITRLQNLIKETTVSLDKYHFSEAGLRIYDFMWGELCDWYLEVTKDTHKNPAILKHVLRETLKLLHPFVPFVTETIWENLGEKEMLISTKWPEYNEKLVFAKETREMEIIHAVISSIRSMREEYKVPASRKIKAVVYARSDVKTIDSKREPIMRLSGLEDLNIKTKGPKIPKSASAFLPGIEIYLPLADFIDPDREKIRIQEEIAAKRGFLMSVERKLKNDNFINNAPDAIVKIEFQKRADTTEAILKLGKQLEDLT